MLIHTLIEDAIYQLNQMELPEAAPMGFEPSN
jgi:hypothetical protein